MIEYWKAIQRRLHEESMLHYPNNILRQILQAYVDGTLNKYDSHDKEFFEQGFLLTCSGSWLDERGAEMGIPRDNGKTASGSAKFYIEEPAATNIIIYKNTIISDEYTGYQYVTTEKGVIAKGETEVIVKIQAMGTGARYNTGEKTITFIESGSIPSHVKVYNNIAITGGVDGESDNEYRKRLFNSIGQNLSVKLLKKRGIIIYSKKKYNDNIRTKMSSLNPYMSNQYCVIPPNSTVMDFVVNELICYRIMQIYIKGWK